MKKIILTPLLVAVLALTAACSSDPLADRYEAEQERREALMEIVEDQIDDIPDWYIEGRESEFGTYTVGYGSSRSLDMAETKATLSAKRKLADRLNGKLSEIIREFATEVGDVENGTVYEEMERATENIIDQIAVYGYRIVEKEVQPGDGGYFKVYTMLEYADEEVNRILRQSLEAQRRAEADERRDELFERLESGLTE